MRNATGADIEQAYRAGRTLAEIADEVGLSAQAVGYILAGRGVPRRARGPRCAVMPTVDRATRLAKVRDMVRAGTPRKQIAEFFRVTPQRASQLIRQACEGHDIEPLDARRTRRVNTSRKG